MTTTTTRPLAVPQGLARPATRTAILVLSLLVGLALAVLWSSELVDQQIGMSVANSVLGGDARNDAIAGSLSGALFAFVSGFAGTFTACNIAVFAAAPAVATQSSPPRTRLRGALPALGWLAAGQLGVAVVYGFVAVLMGRSLPQLSKATVGNQVPVRLLQSVIVFGVIGLAFIYLGLASLGVLPDPLATRPRTRLVILGALIGGFLVGRPYPLFFKLLTYAVNAHNPLYGSLALALQALGNILVMAALVLVASLLGGQRLARWLSQPGRASAVAAAGLLALGLFLVVYWDVRLPAHFGYGWFPTMPWNS